jgi:putative ABC transport system permease protein
MRRNLGFTIVAVVILAIGIGANTALFTTINGVLLRQIPYVDPDRLVAAYKTVNGDVDGAVSRLDYFDYRERSRSFEELAALVGGTRQHTVTGGSEPELVQAGYVTWNLFPTLGVNPVAGRHFLPEEEQQGEARVVLISDHFWRARFGASPDVVGSVLDIDTAPHTVVGVMPRGFRFMFDADLWGLVDRDGPFDRIRDSHSHLVVGRLKSGVSIEGAQSEIDSISSSLEEQYPDTNEGKGLWLTDLHGAMVSDVETMLLLLIAATGLVLVIACGNVAGLFLARGQRRLSEMAMRSALGASRSRLVRQLLTESVLFGMLAGLAGIALAYLLQNLLLHLLPIGELGIERPAIDAQALGFAFTVSIVSGLAVGVLPASKGTATDPARQIKSKTLTSQGIYSARIGSGLVVLQVAVSIALLVGSGLLIRSFIQLATVELGFDADRLLTGRIQIQESDYPTPQERNRFFTSLIEDIEALPGVRSASLINKLPISSPWQNWGIRPADAPPPSGQDSYSAMARWVTPGYFDTMGIPLLKGRDISATDTSGNPRIMVVSENVAQTLFPGQDAIGRSVILGRNSPPYEVIGVVGNARLNTLRGEPDPAMYMSSAQMNATRMQMAVRIAGDPTLLVEPIRRTVRGMNPNVLFAETTSMASILDDASGDFQIVILSLSLFSGVALLLAAIGLYGVLAYQVSQRVNEIGIRQAVGASRVDMLGMILKSGMSLVGAGLLLGLAGAYSGTKVIQNLLFETQPLDPGTYASAGAVLVLVSLLACFIPAWRATRVNLVDVLRQE